MPVASLAIVLAVAGATTMTCARRAASMCSNQPPPACHELSSSSTAGARYRGEGQRHDEPLGGLGGDDRRDEAVLRQQAHELDGLVDRDAAGHADKYVALGRMSFGWVMARRARRRSGLGSEVDLALGDLFEGDGQEVLAA